MNDQITCQVQIPDSYYHELDKEVQQLFSYNEVSHCYASNFPAKQRENGLDEYIIAYFEVALIMANPKYKISEKTHLECDLYRLTKESSIYTLAVSISNNCLETPLHELLLFEEVESTDRTYTLRMIGDQSIFQIA